MILAGRHSLNSKDSIPKKRSKESLGCKRDNNWKRASSLSTQKKDNVSGEDSSHTKKNKRDIYSDTNVEDTPIAKVKKSRIRISLGQKTCHDADDTEKISRRNPKSSRKRTCLSSEKRARSSGYDSDSDSQSSVAERKRKRRSDRAVDAENEENTLLDEKRIPKKKRRRRNVSLSKIQ